MPTIPAARRKTSTNAGVALCLFSATLMGGALPSTVALATTGALNGYRAFLSPAEQISFDYNLAKAGFNVAGICRSSSPAHNKDPQPQSPCHAATLCSDRRRQNCQNGSNGPQLD